MTGHDVKELFEWGGSSVAGITGAIFAYHITVKDVSAILTVVLSILSGIFLVYKIIDKHKEMKFKKKERELLLKKLEKENNGRKI